MRIFGSNKVIVDLKHLIDVGFKQMFDKNLSL